MGKRILLYLAYLVVALCVIKYVSGLGHTESSSRTAVLQQQPDPAPARQGTDEERSEFVATMNKKFRYYGLTARAAPLDDKTLVVESDDLSSELLRDQFVSETFDRQYQEGLCAIGFS
jgi:hypothetical protein